MFREKGKDEEREYNWERIWMQVQAKMKPGLNKFFPSKQEVMIENTSDSAKKL